MWKEKTKQRDDSFLKQNVHSKTFLKKGKNLSYQSKAIENERNIDIWY